VGGTQVDIQLGRTMVVDFFRAKQERLNAQAASLHLELAWPSYVQSGTFEKGDYEFLFAIYSWDTQPVRHKARLSFDGAWHDAEPAMFAACVVTRVDCAFLLTLVAL